MSSSTPGTDEALNFLQRLHPKDFWTLTSIQPDRKAIETRTFTAEKFDAAHTWLEKYNGKRNIYFSANQPKEPVSKKANKSDMGRAVVLHVDLDCRAGEPLESELERLRQLVEEGVNWPVAIPRPQVAVFSGGGYQCFWVLDKHVELGGDLELAADFERYNKALELILGADNCHNVDRIMRLPGTLNIPDEKKMKKGRVPVEARLVFFNERTVSLDQFTQSPRIASDGSAKPNVPIGSNVQRIEDINVLDKWGVKDSVKVIIVQGCLPDPEDLTDKQKKFSRSEWCFYAVCALVRCGVPDEVIFSLITDPAYNISDHVRHQRNVELYANRQLERARDRVANGPLMLDPNNPLPSARTFVMRKQPTLMFYNDDWLVHHVAAYREMEEDSIRADLYKFLEPAMVQTDKAPVPFKPTNAKVHNVVDALRAIAHKPRDTVVPPCWLTGPDDPPAKELLACGNGLLHLPTGVLHDLSEDFFTRNALTFAYDQSAPAPTAWLAFLDTLWPDDKANIDTLQEMFGYLLLPDTSQQKMFLLVGPPRSGKGTIARVLTEMVGKHNTSAPTLSGLADSFGIEPLLGKQLAIISDMRLGGKTDHAALTENLLRISGEDMVMANRKYKHAWHGRLAIRFLIMTNQMPRFTDSSGALANRFVPLIMTNSFLGKENPNLINDILPELPGILLWAIAGWHRLQQRGHFALPLDSQYAMQQLVDLASPVSAFVRDCCVVGGSEIVPKKLLFAAYRNWCNTNGDLHVGAMNIFASDLIAAMHGKVRHRKPTVNGQRVPCYAGIGLVAQKGEVEDGKQIPF